MMVAKRILEDSARLEHNVSEILEKTNGSLCDSNQAEMFVTVWLGILEISTGRLTAANAGHEYPAFQKNEGCFELYKDKHGFVIGGMKDVQYREYIIQMNPGDKLFVYTDGLPEAINRKNEQFGLDRALDTLNNVPSLKPELLIETVHNAVDTFAGTVPQFDDLTMLSLVWHGSENSEQ